MPGPQQGCVFDGIPCEMYYNSGCSFAAKNKPRPGDLIVEGLDSSLFKGWPSNDVEYTPYSGSSAGSYLGQGETSPSPRFSDASPGFDGDRQAVGNSCPKKPPLRSNTPPLHPKMMGPSKRTADQMDIGDCSWDHLPFQTMTTLQMGS